MVASMIDWRRGDNVIINDLEHPANTLPWMHLGRKGVNVKVAKNVGGRIALSDLEQLIDENTRVIAASSVSFCNGFRIDLEDLVRLAEDHGAYVVVDAIQSLGALTLDVRKTGVHFVAAQGLKWLCAPFGSGILYCKRGLVEEFVPELVGTENLDVPEGFLTKSVRLPSVDTVSIYDRGLAKTAKRFQYSASELPALWGLAAALKYLNEIGISSIESRVLKLSDYLADELQRIGATVTSPLEDKHRSGIVAYAGDLRTVKVLNNEGVAVDLRYAGGQGGIRVSTHFYNNEDDVDKLIAIQKRIA
jgi:cysteine desulfurase/selenocysteine lyase